ncbi:hypothetical protein [Leptolyngbya sp. 7M]|uniref:hypothetical protein n=1 Tax=Leptolyngbya sp. 7M TaxID=2812896 RepID=UPI001B8C82A2|nr:hypothetical protein [Leptolyngbya sp. 7M]QYO63117.1 hypothetical protein JVX88_24585 [Leptolyngbya sp. 7M]
MNGFLLAAAVVSLLTFLVHLFWGGYDIINPLLKASDLQDMPKLTAYYGWHIVTLVLLAMTCAYAYVAFVQPDVPLTVMLTSIAAACTLLSVVLIVTRQLQPLDYPQWAFFLPIALFGALGLILG